MEKHVSLAPNAVYDDGALYLLLGIGPSTLAQARRSGTLRFTRKGKRIFYIGQWLLDWMEADAAEKGGAK